MVPDLTARTSLPMTACARANRQRRWPLERELDTFPRLRHPLDHAGMQICGGATRGGNP